MANQVIKASLVKSDDGKSIMLQIEPIRLSTVASVKPEADGTVHRATLLHLTNRTRDDGDTVITPIKGMKGDAPYLAVTLSADIEGAQAMGFTFAVKESAKPVKAKRTGVNLADLSRKPGQVRTRKLAAGE